MPKLKRPTEYLCASDFNKLDTTSIQLRLSTQAFLASQARTHGATVQALIARIVDGFAALSRAELPSRSLFIQKRFLRIMSAHGLGSGGIIDVLSSFGVALSGLDQPEGVQASLSNEVLSHVAKLFHVRFEWLTTEGERALPVMYWDADRLSTELVVACRKALRPTVSFVHLRCNSVVALVQREQKTASGTVFFTLQVWPLDRWITSASMEQQLVRLTALCRQLNVPVSNVELARHTLHDLLFGERLPVELLRELPVERLRPTQHSQSRLHSEN